MIKSILTIILVGIAYTLSFAQNGIAGVGMQLHATFHNIGVQINYTGDANINATASLEANINGAGFQTVHRLSRVGTNRFVGTVFSLPPETNVEVRVVLSDPDGVTNSTHTASISTRSEQIPASTGNKIHVSTTGNNNTGDGSTANPYKTIQHAVDLALPGNTIAIHTGSYHESVEIAYKDETTANTPITITNAGDGAVILDGTDQIFNDPNAWTNEGNNIYSIPLNDTYYIGANGNRLWRYNSLNDLQNLIYNTDGGFFPDAAANKVYLKLPGNAAPTTQQISVSSLDHAFEIFESNHIIIRGLSFRNFNATEHSASIQVLDKSIRLWITNNIFENSETFIRLEGYVEDLVVMNNEFSDQGVNVLDWDFIKDHQHWLERGALYITNDGYTGTGTIFYKNNVHDMFDGVKIVGSEDDFTSYPTNSDLEENTFYHLSDDGVEVDGFSCNIRILNNRFENILAGVSVAPAIAGPTYIIRNLMLDLNNVASPDWETTAVKFNYDGERSGEIFIYHNTASTFEANQAAISITNDSNWDDLFIKNNIWQGTEFGFYHWLDNTSSLTLSHDYDLLYAPSGGILALFDGNEYTTITAYNNAIGLCTNCVTGDPLFLNIAGSDYHLTGNSPAIDKGVLIQGINQDFFGSNPDMGAFEYQAILPVEYLGAFNVSIMDNQVKLNWSTASEKNSAYFEIERSVDARSWEKIGKVFAKNNSTTNSSYSAIDPSPLEGASYYRLKLLDLDASSSYSNVASVYFEKFDFSFQPNPTTGSLELSFSKEMEATISVSDLLGKVLLRKTSKGNQTNIDLNFLPNGLYWISVQAKARLINKKLGIQK